MTAAGPGSTLVGRYLLSEREACDLVDVTAWSAHDSVLNRHVRVSLLSGDHTSEAVDSARRAALVADPRLTRVLDVGTDEGVAYVVTEPYAGISLSEVVAGGIVDAQQARAIVGEAAAALEVARRRGVHHLALRPEALRVDGDRVVITGLGLDAGISGQDQRDPAETSHADTVGLVALLYYAMTARWAGPSLDVPWITSDSVHPLPAQRNASGILPLSELVPGVPAELSDLCAQVLADADRRASSRATTPANSDETQEFDALSTVPESPADLVTALEPWGALSVVAAIPAFVQAAPAAPPTVNRVSRQSIRSAFDIPLTTPPGTPPPAVPFHRPSTGRIHRAPLTGSVPLPEGASYPAPTYADTPPAPPAYAAAASQQTTAYPSQPAPPPPAVQPAAAPSAPSAQPAQAPRQYQAQAQAQATADPGTETHTGPFATTSATKTRAKTTWIIMPIVLLLVVVAVVWGVTSLLSGFSDTSTPPSAGQGGGTTTGEQTPANETPAEVPVNTTPLTIATSGLLDPDVTDPNDSGEKPEAVPRAIDGDPATFWFTYSYKSANFGKNKSKTGYTFTLDEAATVQRIVLDTNSVGGRVEVRALDGDTVGSEVLASAAFSKSVELELDPATKSTSFVLFITELPPAADGTFRVELNEITVY